MIRNAVGTRSGHGQRSTEPRGRDHASLWRAARDRRVGRSLSVGIGSSRAREAVARASDALRRCERRGFVRMPAPVFPALEAPVQGSSLRPRRCFPQRECGSFPHWYRHRRAALNLPGSPGSGNRPPAFSGANAGNPNNGLSVPNTVGRWQGFRPLSKGIASSHAPNMGLVLLPREPEGEQAAKPPPGAAPAGAPGGVDGCPPCAPTPAAPAARSVHG